MNLRDLWDNVVLRGILGYIVPRSCDFVRSRTARPGTTGTTAAAWVARAATQAGLDVVATLGGSQHRIAPLVRHRSPADVGSGLLGRARTLVVHR